MQQPIQRPNDPPLNRAQALAGAEITPADRVRALLKWRRRMRGFEERIKATANVGNSEVGDARP